jgi:hypothetical protein
VDAYLVPIHDIGAGESYGQHSSEGLIRFLTDWDECWSEIVFLGAQTTQPISNPLCTNES